MKVTMVDPEGQLLREIADKRMTRDDVKTTYAFAIRQADEVDFAEGQPGDPGSLVDERAALHQGRRVAHGRGWRAMSPFELIALVTVALILAVLFASMGR